MGEEASNLFRGLGSSDKDDGERSNAWIGLCCTSIGYVIVGG